jgi:hypothetical protein
MTFQLAGLVIDGPPYSCADTVVSVSRAAREVAGAAPADAPRLASPPVEIAA